MPDVLCTHRAGMIAVANNRFRQTREQPCLSLSSSVACCWQIGGAQGQLRHGLKKQLRTVVARFVELVANWAFVAAQNVAALMLVPGRTCFHPAQSLFNLGGDPLNAKHVYTESVRRRGACHSWAYEGRLCSRKSGCLPLLLPIFVVFAAAADPS